MGKVWYPHYDATGTKLKKVTVENGGSVLYNAINHTTDITSTTSYINGFIYESKSYSNTNLSALAYTDVLQFAGHEEGRIRFIPAVGTIPASFQYDYMLKDHLGNVRMVLTEAQQQDRYPTATLEGSGAGSPVEKEKDYFDFNTAYVVSKPTNTNPSNLLDYVNDNGTNNPNTFGDKNAISSIMYKLNATTNRSGLSMVLKVMAGDKVNILGKSYYQYSSGVINNTSFTGSELIASLLSVGGANNLPAAHGATTTNLNNNVTGTLNPLSLFSNNNPPNLTNNVKAGINYIIFDEQFKFVAGNFDPVNNNSSGGVKNHTVQNIAIPKNGYIYIYCSNESNIDVFFDNLEVVHDRSPILEETHYYPFGLTMSGISSRAAGKLENKKQFNGIEHTTDLDLNQYDAYFRNYDPQIGRWFQIDPKPDFMWSPYAAMSDNPILYSDFLGDSVKLGNLYDKDKDGNYKNVNEIISFELFASTKDGKKYILDHAEKGFSLEGAFVNGLSINAKKEGKSSAQGVDIGLSVVDHIAGGDAKTDKDNVKVVDGRLKIPFQMERSGFGAPFADKQKWRDNMLHKVDSWTHEFFLHGDLLEQKFLNGSQVNPYSHLKESLVASKYYSTGAQVLQGVQSLPLNMNQGLKPHSGGYLYYSIMMPGLGHLVPPVGAPKY